ncbi:hypothetical protein IFM89_007948 [Coptis chinensis]|uniref:DM2 domain-containing protein n=1 Tax=Coptis chinensis TaxID=261450 RepID=A0A835M7U6_9MAGN|nr:hypothetical protein IFM89_007948 [Coptis chinensis]
MANSSFRRLSGLVSQALIRSSSSTLGFSLPKTNHVRTFAASSKPAAASKKPAAASKKPAAATGSDKSTKKKAAPSGISKPIPISAALQDVFGVPEIARTQALKQIWVHIKEHNLQDPENKKIIVCDEKLKKVFAGKERVGFLEIARLLNPHFIK